MSIYKNQREDTRTNISGKIKYARTKNGEMFDARLHDCSRDGLGLISKYPYLPETEILISSKGKNDTTTQKAQVAWSKKVQSHKKGDPEYRVGVKYAT